MVTPQNRATRASEPRSAVRICWPLRPDRRMALELRVRVGDGLGEDVGVEGLELGQLVDR